MIGRFLGLGIGALALGVLAQQALAQSPQVKRGLYLVDIAGRNDCHTPGSFLGKRDVSRRLGGSDVGFSLPGMGALVARFGAQGRAFFDALALAVGIAFLALIFYPGFDYAMDEIAITTPALQIPNIWRAAALPVGIALMLVLAALRFTRRHRRRDLALAIVVIAAIAAALIFAKPLLSAIGNYKLVVFFVVLVGTCVLAAVPIAFAFGIGTFAYLALTTHVPWSVVVSRMRGKIDIPAVVAKCREIGDRCFRTRQQHEIANRQRLAAPDKNEPHIGLAFQGIEIIEIGDMRQQRHRNDHSPIARSVAPRERHCVFRGQARGIGKERHEAERRPSRARFDKAHDGDAQLLSRQRAGLREIGAVRTGARAHPDDLGRARHRPRPRADGGL